MWHTWEFWARPEQLPPGHPQHLCSGCKYGGTHESHWHVWLLLSGRGFGKTRTLSEWVIEEAVSGRRRRIAIVAETAADARDVLVEGESGILEKSRPENRPLYEPSKRRLTWPNGAIATTYSAEDPDSLRGPQHDGAIADEIGKWRYAPDTWSNLMFGLRLGTNPQVVVATTPRPTPLIKELMVDPTTHVTRGTTYDNRANLPASFFETIIRKYEGTSLGQQELMGQLLEQIEGALFSSQMIEAGRVREAPTLKRIVVAIDPAVTSNATSDETGIVVVGVSHDNHGYVLEDLSGRYSPDQWAAKAVAAYHKWKANYIVAETNNGGEMVAHTVRTVDKTVPYKAVHASRGKVIRAEPVVALYEQQRIHHLGMLPALEDQMTSWVPGDKSPDRLDALVWGLTDLMITGQGGQLVTWS